jgi:lipopolysaccharide exporter
MKNISSLKWMSISSIIVAVVQFIQGILLAKIMGVEFYGFIATILIIIAFTFTIIDLGYYNNFVKKRISFLTAFNFFLPISLVISLISIFAIPFILDLDNNIVILQQIIFIYIFFYSLSQVYFIFFQRTGLFYIISIVEIVSITLSFIYFLYKIYIDDMNLVNYFITFSIFGFTRFILFFIFSLKNKNLFYKNKNKNKNLFIFLKSGFSFAKYQILERFLNFMITRSEQIIIVSILGSKFFGIYIFAWNLVIQPITKVIPIFTKILYPNLCKIKDRYKVKEIVILNLRSIKVISYPILFGISLVSKQFIVLFFDKSWYDTIVILKVLAILYIFKVTFDVLNATLLAQNYSKISMYWVAIQVIINSLSLLIYLKFIGGINILLPISCSIIILKIIELFIYIKIFNFNIKELVMDDLKIIFSLFFIYVSTFQLVDNISILNFVIIIIISIVIYLISLSQIYKTNPLKLIKI